MLRDSALKIIRALKIEGGCNIQFALDPNSFQYYLIEVNPRVSRSSALASKASGFPIARVSAKISIGMTLDEIMIAGNFGRNDPRMKFKRSSSHLYNQIQRAFHRFKRNLQFLTTYPGEVIWEPFARIWHYAWKRITLWTI